MALKKNSISAIKCTLTMFIHDKYLISPTKEPYNAL